MPFAEKSGPGVFPSAAAFSRNLNSPQTVVQEMEYSVLARQSARVNRRVVFLASGFKSKSSFVPLHSFPDSQSQCACRVSRAILGNPALGRRNCGDRQECLSCRFLTGQAIRIILLGRDARKLLSSGAEQKYDWPNY